MSCVNSTGTADRRAALFEHDLEAATPIPVIRKPFDAIAEGLIRKNSRGDRTSIELFSGSLRNWTKSLISIVQALAS